MGKVLPGESTGLATMIDSAGRYGVRAHSIADEQDDVPRFVRVPAVRKRLLQFFVGGAAPVATICVREGEELTSAFVPFPQQRGEVDLDRSIDRSMQESLVKE